MLFYQNRHSGKNCLCKPYLNFLQWFGNLVTCKWWNDLWVQEGMASYIEYYAVDKVHPDWEMVRFTLFSSDFKDLVGST